METTPEQLIPTAEFEDLLKEACIRIQKVVEENQANSVAPMLVCILPKLGSEQRQQAPLLLDEFPEGEAKRRLLFSVGKSLGEQQVPVVAAFLISEAWMKALSVAEGWRARARGVPRPSSAPDRTEAVVVWGRTVDGRAAFGMSQITRDRRDRVNFGNWNLTLCAQCADEGVEENLLGFFFAGYFSDGNGEPEA
jgi:hypothetical protein